VASNHDAWRRSSSGLAGVCCCRSTRLKSDFILGTYQLMKSQLRSELTSALKPDAARFLFLHFRPPFILSFLISVLLPLLPVSSFSFAIVFLALPVPQSEAVKLS